MILVTGGRGVVASYVPRAFQDWNYLCLGKQELDVTQAHAVRDIIATVNPDVVLHLAAKTDVDWCETNPLEAFRVNAEGTRNVTAACIRAGAELVYVSTAGVFGADGRQGPFREDSLTSPANVYGQAKLAGEWAASRVNGSLERLLVVRSGWMMGGGERDRKFVGKMLAQMRAGDPIHAVVDKVGSPTYALDLLHLIRGLLERTALAGIVHGANSGPVASRFNVAFEVAAVLGHPGRVAAADSARFPLVAARADSEALVSARLPKPLQPRDWREALREYVLEESA